MNYFINQRVKEFLESREIKQIDFAKVIGLNSDRVSKWFRMKEKIPAEHVIVIIEKYKDIDARWLLTGERQSEISSEEIPEILEEAAAKYKTDCCRRCKDLENQIQLYEKLIAVYENPPKKETHDASGASSGEDTKRNKAV